MLYLFRKNSCENKKFCQIIIVPTSTLTQKKLNFTYVLLFVSPKVCVLAANELSQFAWRNKVLSRRPQLPHKHGKLNGHLTVLSQRILHIDLLLKQLGSLDKIVTQINSIDQELKRCIHITCVSQVYKTRKAIIAARSDLS